MRAMVALGNESHLPLSGLNGQRTPSAAGPAESCPLPWRHEYTGRPRPATSDGLRSVLRADATTGCWRWHWDARFLDNKLHVLDAGARERRAEQVWTELEAAAGAVWDRHVSDRRGGRLGSPIRLTDTR